MRISDWSSDVCSSDLHARYSAHQMMELGLDGLEIGEDIGVVEFEVIEDGGARPVMHEFGALVEECRVVFVGFDNEEGRNAGDIQIGRASCRERVCQYV